MSRPPIAVQRRFFPVSTCALLVAVFFLMSATSRQAAPQFERLEIVRQGRVVMELDGDANGGVIRLFNVRGDETVVLRTNEEGGADIRLNERRGGRALAIRAGDRTLRITADLDGREFIVLQTGEDMPVLPGDDDLNSLKMIAARLGDLTKSVRELRHEQNRLEEQMRELQPGRSTNSIIDRVNRSIVELQRGQIDVERELRRVSDELARRRMNADDLRRRVQRLESRRPG